MRALRFPLLLLCAALAPALFAQTTVGTFSGGDPGDGLDLDGNIVYAVNFAGPAAGIVRDAYFTNDSAPGVSVTATNSIVDWLDPSFGSTPNDDALEQVMQSIRWTDSGPVYVSLANLVPGRSYKLQLLFAEGCCERGFDVYAEGSLIRDDFAPYQYVASTFTPTQGVVLTYQFVAPDSTLNLELRSQSSPFSDTNPIINGLTLEAIALPAEAPAADVPALDPRGLAVLAAILAVAALLTIRRA